MMNRDLMQRQMFRNGGGVVPMQDGGEPTFRERIEALSKAAGRSIEGLMEPNRDPYENMNPIQDPSAPMNLSPEEQAARRAQYEIQQGRFTQAEIEQILRNNPEYGDYGSMEGAPRFDLPTPSGPRRTEYNDTPIRRPVQEPVFTREQLEELGSISRTPEGFQNGGPVYYMQEGGMAPMGMPPGMPPQGMPPQGMPPQGAMMPNMSQAQQAGMDPAILEQMLAQASQGIGSLDEAEDYEQVMNSITGTSATIQERRMELADLVGDEDAQQTPDSVLTLVQPVIMMSKTEEGIGGLAQDQMTEAVTGDMAGGIMSTIDMGAQEGPAPVNFRFGGAVQYMEPGGVAMTEQQQQDYGQLQQDYDMQRNFYGQLIDKDAQSKALQSQQDMTKAQMLFDLAQTGLAIAAPGPRTMSVAEKLAYAAQQTELFPKIGARAAELGKFKQAQDKESSQFDLAAAQGAMGERSARKAHERSLDVATAKAKAKGTDFKPMKLVIPGLQDRFFNGKSPEEVDSVRKIVNEWREANPEQAAGGASPQIFTVGTEPTSQPTAAVYKQIRDNKTGEVVGTVDINTKAGKEAVQNAASLNQTVYNTGTYTETKSETGSKSVTVNRDITIRGTLIRAGSNVLLSKEDIRTAQKTSPNAFTPYEKTDAINPFGGTAGGLALQYFTNGRLEDDTLAVDAYAKGADDRTMDSQIKAYTAPVPDARGFMQKRQLPDFVIAAIKERVLNGYKSPVPLATLGLTETEMTGINPNQDIPLINPDGTVNIERATSNPVFIMTGLDYTNSQGFVSSLNRTFNFFAGQAAELGFGEGYAGNTGAITSKSDRQLSALARKTISVGRAGTEGRVFALDIELLKQEVEGFKAGGGKSDISALDQLIVVRSTLASNYARAKYIVDESDRTPGAFEKSVVGAAKLAMRDTEQLIAEYTGAILAYEANIVGRGSAITSNGGKVTGSLGREDDQKKKTSEIESLVSEAPSIPEMKKPEPRESVLTRVNTARPETVLSVEQPPVPENNVSQDQYTSDQLNPEVLAFIKDNVAKETFGDLQKARPGLWNRDQKEKLRTSPEDIALGYSRALAGLDMLPLEERKVLIEKIQQQIIKNRGQN